MTAASVAVALMLAFAYWGMHLVDRDAIAQEAKFVRDGLRAVSHELPIEQESTTIWDDAVVETRAGNQLWM